MGFVYIIRCSDSPKVYIGQTTKTIERRWYEHTQCAKRLAKSRKNGYELRDIRCSHLYNAMVSYGVDKFSINQLCEVENEQLNAEEVKFIQLYNSRTPNGYNLTSGGDSNYSHADETIQRITQTKLEKIDEVRNPKLRGLPAHTAYRNNSIHGEQILINGHPLCKHKTFSVNTYGSFDAAVMAVSEFITELEKSNIPYKPPKKGVGLPKGIVEIPDGYRVNKIHKGRTYDRKFKSKALTKEQNREKALQYYAELMKITQD